ncbi:MAG: formylglycine-generating enzyme family protein [Deltaproteobacteria bacterium]|nr:formylglycine-generating enzyme family protein [Deltaproteobacteria bacterium]
MKREWNKCPYNLRVGGLFRANVTASAASKFSVIAHAKIFHHPLEAFVSERVARNLPLGIPFSLIALLMLSLLTSRSGFAEDPKKVRPEEMAKLISILDVPDDGAGEKSVSQQPARMKALTKRDELRIAEILQVEEKFLRALGLRPTAQSARSAYTIARRMKEIFENEETFLDETIDVTSEEWNRREAVHFFLGRLAEVEPALYGDVIEKYTLLLEPEAKEGLKHWRERRENFDEKEFLGTVEGDEKWAYAGEGGRSLLELKASILADRGNYTRAAQTLELLRRSRSERLRSSHSVEIRLLAAYAAGGEEKRFEELKDELQATLRQSSFPDADRRAALEILERFIQGPCQVLLEEAKKRIKTVERGDLDWTVICKAQKLRLTKRGEERVSWLRVLRDFDRLEIFGDKDFASIPAGIFMMGSPEGPEGEVNRSSDEKLHRVEITKGFEIARTEVTQLQWFLVMGDNPSHFSKQNHCPGEYLVLNGISLCPNHPVETVSWNDVQVFLRTLNERKKGEKYTYRLPTEAEWEYAARGRVKRDSSPAAQNDELVVQQAAYSFGNDPAQLREYAWYYANSLSQTHAVGQKKANLIGYDASEKPYGLYDMHGNVWEWCQDWYNDDYDQSGKGEKLSDGSESFKDPQGSESGSYRVIRGGCWYRNPEGLRSAFRGNYGPDIRFDGVGVRVVRTCP